MMKAVALSGTQLCNLSRLQYEQLHCEPINSVNPMELNFGYWKNMQY